MENNATHVVIMVFCDGTSKRTDLSCGSFDMTDDKMIWEVFWKNNLYKDIQMSDFVLFVEFRTGETILWKNRYGNGGRVVSNFNERKQD